MFGDVQQLSVSARKEKWRGAAVPQCALLAATELRNRKWPFASDYHHVAYQPAYQCVSKVASRRKRIAPWRMRIKSLRKMRHVFWQGLCIIVTTALLLNKTHISLAVKGYVVYEGIVTQLYCCMFVVGLLPHSHVWLQTDTHLTVNERKMLHRGLCTACLQIWNKHWNKLRLRWNRTVAKLSTCTSKLFVRFFK